MASPPAQASPEKPKATIAPEAQGTGKAGAAPKTDDRVIIENADDYRYDPNTKIHYLRGQVIFVTRDLRLYCDAADYNEDADTMKASGNLRAVDRNATITGDLLEADFGKELAIITGHVRVVAQKRPDSQKHRADITPTTEMTRGKGPQKRQKSADTQSNPSLDRTTPATTTDKSSTKGGAGTFAEYEYKRTVITCERVEYYYADDVKRMVATPRLKAVQEERTVFADRAIFDDLQRTLTLTGSVLMQTADGDELRCDQATVGVDDDWVKADNISGVTLRKPKKTAPDQAPPGTAITGEASPPAGAGEPAPPPPASATAPAPEAAGKP